MSDTTISRCSCCGQEMHATDWVERLRQDADIQYWEKKRAQAGMDAAIKHLSHIYGLLWPEPVESDGKKWKFHPPDELVREAWEGLSRAIREIPTIIEAAKQAAENPTQENAEKVKI